MKKNIIALAVASAIAAPVAMADAPTIYGKLNVNVNTQTDNGNGVNDTASRLGIKGSEDLGNGLKAVYKVEFGIDLEGSGVWSDRNQYLGLAGGFGTVLIGKHDSPLKMAQPTDLFNDGAADNGVLGMGYGGKTGEIRASEVLAYVSPSFSGVKVILAGTSPAVDDTTTESVYITSTGSVVTTKPTSGDFATINYDVTNADADKNDRSLTSGTHAAITYGSTKKGLFLSAAMDSFGEDGYGLAGTYSQTSYAAQYKTGGLTVNGMIRKFDDGVSADESDEGSATFIGAAYKMGKITVKGKMMTADYDGDNDDKGVQTAIGLGYSLGKKTSAYVYTTNRNAALNGAGNKDAADSSTKSFIGMVHKF